jgi:hypothetical protein
MIQSSTSIKGKALPMDNSDDLSKDELACVQAAMSAGLTEFSVPTEANDTGKTDWRVRQIVVMRDKSPMCYLVACKVTATHFTVLGPAVPMANTNGLQKR